MWQFKIFETSNGWFMSSQKGKVYKSYVFKPEERIRMFAVIDDLMGEDPGEKDVGSETPNQSSS